MDAGLPVYRDDVFAPLDRDHDLVRIAGGNETEVYLTDDARFVVKVKAEDAHPDPTVMLALARLLQHSADAFAACLGSRYSTPTAFVLSRNSRGEVQVVAVQPYLGDAVPLRDVPYARLSRTERARIAAQLREIMHRAQAMYRREGCMPDLYGRVSATPAERKRQKTWYYLPQRAWSFVVQRNLLRAQNLMVTNDPERHIRLIDYDPVRRGKLYRTIYYAARRALFWRDAVLIEVMLQTGIVPGGRGPAQRDVRSGNWAG